MKRLILIIFTCISSFKSVAQIPQFAVVRPDGTTYICPTFDSAYNKSNNGDIIYLPGGVFSISNPINKSLHLFGAGSDEDSCVVTGPTIINTCTLGPNAGSGSIEGVKTTGGIVFDSPTTIANYSIKKCEIGGGIGFTTGTAAELITVINCFIGFKYTGAFTDYSIWGPGILNNSTFFNNRISNPLSYQITSLGNLFSNNIFFYYQQYISLQLFNGSTYQNNIFQISANTITNNSFFYNNINGYPTGSNNAVYNYVIESADLTFINPGNVYPPGICSYDKHFNYELKPTSLGKNTGTDGMDRGNYGGLFSWVNGSIPSNPHIYLKQVGTQTNNSGQLEIQFKIRANN